MRCPDCGDPRMLRLLLQGLVKLHLIPANPGSRCLPLRVRPPARPEGRAGGH